MNHFQIYRNRRLGEGSYGIVYVCKWYGTKAAVKIFQSRSRTTGSRKKSGCSATLEASILCSFTAKQRLKASCVWWQNTRNADPCDACWITRIWILISRHALSTVFCMGLRYLHGNGIIHCDLKSPNILITQHYEAKIADFGLATLKSAAKEKMNARFGSLRWMAPELFKDPPRYSFASDIYALGTVFWRLRRARSHFLISLTIVFWKWSRMDSKKIKFQTLLPVAFAEKIRACWRFDPDQRITVDALTPMQPSTFIQEDDGLSDDNTWSVEVNIHRFKKAAEYVIFFY